jgi:hypothetical protein
VSVINISLFEQVVPRPKLQGRITKSTKLQSLWKGPPYLIATVNPPMLYQIKDRTTCSKSEMLITDTRAAVSTTLENLFVANKHFYIQSGLSSHRGLL